MAKKDEKIVVGESLEQQAPKQYRNWLILLYDDTTSYDFKEVLRICKAQRKYAYIKHLPEETEKKPHYHVIISLDNSTTKSGMAKRLGIPQNYISEVKNFRAMCRYLTHKDDEDKIQYSLDQVIMNKPFEREFKLQYDDIESEEEIINNIYIFISKLSDKPYHEALRTLIQYINISCYDRIYKRYRFEFTDYLKSCCNLQ